MDTKKEIKVYHGTSYAHGTKILDEQEFLPSTKNNEWLGKGVYFFSDKRDAEWWARDRYKRDETLKNNPVVLSANLVYDEERFINLSDKAQMRRLVLEAKKMIRKIRLSGLGAPSNFETEEELMCLCCNLYKKKYKIDLIAYNFPRLKRNDAGFPFVWYQEQYCATSNSIIHNIKMEGR